MKHIACPRCPHGDSFFIVEITEDYVTLECPDCNFQFAIAAGQDDGK